MQYHLVFSILSLINALVTAPLAFPSSTEILWEHQPTTVAIQDKQDKQEKQDKQDKQDKHSESRDLAELDETRENFELAFGSRVEVSGINGSVDVETSSSNMVEVHIVRSARFREDLQFRKVSVERTANSLRIHGENQDGRSKEVRQRVMVRVPRQVEISVHGVNGRVAIGELEGKARVSGINGKVEMARVTSFSEISGINGNLVVTIAKVDDQGTHISGINGKIELQIAENANAEIIGTGINGRFSSEGLNLIVEGKQGPTNFRGKIGSGGPTITISGVNGNIRIVSATRM